MKTKLQRIVTGLALVAFPLITFAQTTVYNVNPEIVSGQVYYDDGIISDVANLAAGGVNPWIEGNGIDGTKVLKVGASASTGAAFNTNAVIPFKLPVRPAGKLVVAANLKVNVAYLRHWIDADIDLYGLSYNASSTIDPLTFYDQAYPDATAGVTAIQSSFFVRDTGGAEPLGTEILTDREVNSSSGGDLALISYINAQYDAGAVAGDYVFLRLSINATTGTTLAGAHYYGISDGQTIETPELMLEIEDAAAGPTPDFTVTAPTEDGYVSDPAIVMSNNPYLFNEMKLGNSDVAGNANTTSAIIPFQLPARPMGETVDFAKLNVYVSYGREWILSNVDLYGLTFQADAGTGREIFNTDHFTGVYPDVTAGVTGIEDDYFAKNVAGGVLDTPRWEETTADAALIAYIDAQYDAGAVAGDWIFLRLSVDDPSTGAHYFKVEGGDTALTDTNGDLTPANLQIGFSGSLSVNSYDKQSLGLYPNPTNGRLRVSLDGFSNEASLTIYSLTGQLVHKEKIEASSRNSFETQLNLKAGLYIVKLEDGERGATQKLIVQ